jgi:O-antigen/teichoic acid export membrane protein
LEYGKFAYAFAICAIIVQPVVEMGLDMVIVKWVSRGKHEVVKKAFFIRIVASLISIGILLTTSMLLSVNKVVIFTLFFYFAIIAFQNVAFSFFRGMEDMKLEGLINPLQKSSALLFLFLLPLFGLRNAQLGSAALLLSAIFGSFVLLIVYQKSIHKYYKETRTLHLLPYTELIKEGITLGGVVFLWLIYFRIDSVMLGYMRGDVEVGVYNVAYKIMEGIFFIPSIIMLVFYPKLVKLVMFEDIFRKLFVILGGIGAISSLLLYAFSSSIIRLIYGSEFIGSIPVLRTLSLVLLPVFLGHLLTQSLVALDLNKAYLLVAFLGVLINISLNIYFIPSFGANGAAWATLITEAIIVIFCTYFVWRKKPVALSYRSFDLSVRGLLSNLEKD